MNSWVLTSSLATTKEQMRRKTSSWIVSKTNQWHVNQVDSNPKMAKNSWPQVRNRGLNFLPLKVNAQKLITIDEGFWRTAPINCAEFSTSSGHNRLQGLRRPGACQNRVYKKGAIRQQHTSPGKSISYLTSNCKTNIMSISRRQKPKAKYVQYSRICRSK